MLHDLQGTLHHDRDHILTGETSGLRQPRTQDGKGLSECGRMGRDTPREEAAVQAADGDVVEEVGVADEVGQEAAVAVFEAVGGT